MKLSMFWGQEQLRQGGWQHQIWEQVSEQMLEVTPKIPGKERDTRTLLGKGLQALIHFPQMEFCPSLSTYQGLLSREAVQI